MSIQTWNIFALLVGDTHSCIISTVYKRNFCFNILPPYKIHTQCVYFFVDVWTILHFIFSCYFPKSIPQMMWKLYYGMLIEQWMMWVFLFKKYQFLITNSKIYTSMLHHVFILLNSMAFLVSVYNLINWCHEKWKSQPAEIFSKYFWVCMQSYSTNLLPVIFYCRHWYLCYHLNLLSCFGKIFH